MIELYIWVACMQSGGLSWQVPTGRKDGRVSIGSEALTLPGPNDTVATQKDKFSNKGLNTEDLVILAGTHTIQLNSNNLLQFSIFL